MSESAITDTMSTSEKIKYTVDNEVKKRTHPEQIKLQISKFADTTTIIFKWTQDVTNRNKSIGYFWGFGDILRGMISLYQYCKLNRQNFRVDISSHPLGAYFDATSNPIFITTKTNDTLFYGGDGGAFNTLQIPNVNECQVFCNVWPITPLTFDEVNLVPSILKIKPCYIIQLPPKYNVFHLRFNDNYIRADKLTDEMEMVLRYVLSLYQPGDILCSNVPLVKQVAKYVHGITSFNEDISGSHIGYETAGNVHDSMIADFQIITNATTIYTYSSYFWISGFVQWASLCYNKVLVDMKDKIIHP